MAKQIFIKIGWITVSLVIQPNFLKKRFPSIRAVQMTAKGISCVLYGKSQLENIRSSCSGFSSSEHPLQRSSAYLWYAVSNSASTSFFLQLTVPPASNEDSVEHPVRLDIHLCLRHIGITCSGCHEALLLHIHPGKVQSIAKSVNFLRIHIPNRMERLLKLSRERLTVRIPQRIDKGNRCKGF